MPFWNWDHKKIHQHLHALTGWGMVWSGGFNRTAQYPAFGNSDQIFCSVLFSKFKSRSKTSSFTISSLWNSEKASTEFIQAPCIWNLPNSLDEKSSGPFQKKQLQILPGLSLQHYDTLLSSSCMHFTACYVSREAWLFDREPETYGDAASSAGRAGSKIPSFWLQTPSSDLGHLHNLLKAKLQVTFSREPNWCPCWASRLDK